MHAGFSSLPYVQLSSVKAYSLLPSASVESNCVSSGAVAFLFLFVKESLPSWNEKSGDPPSA
jgi:hypothetical protein